MLVRSRHCGELNQGLQNLEAPCEGNVFSFFLRRAKRTKKHARGLRTSGLPGTIQSSVGSNFAENSGGSCRNRFCPQNAGEKALNRCDTPVLQRKELERTEKEQRYSLVDSRLWLGANGRWRVEKGFSEWAIRKGLSKWIAFGLRKRATFRLMQNQPIKKSFFSAQQNFNLAPRPNLRKSANFICETLL